MKIELTPRHTPGASVNRTGNRWRMEIPAGSADTYCLAQSDDYISFSRGQFQHAPPWTLSLDARVSASDLPGTWGFGLWNDPFGFSLGFGGTARRLPALPNTAWFFHASPPNWLSLHNAIPGRGFFAGAIKAPRIPSILLAPAILALPLVAIRPVSRLLRRLAGRMIEQDACLIPVDVTNWHKYSIEWLHKYVEFNIDDQPVLRTSLSPPPPLGLVIWIDNQYAFWDPTGRLGYGTLGNPAAWLEVTDIQAG